jgi:hypothetical protein
MTFPLAGYPKDFTLAALIYQISLSNQQSQQFQVKEFFCLA